MAALNPFVDDATDSGVSIPADLIPLFVANYEYVMPVGMRLAWRRSGLGNVPVRFGRFGAMSSAPSSKTESDQFALVDVTQSESSITPAIIGFRSFVSDEAMSSVGNGSVPTGVVEQMLLALIDQMDSSILSSSTSATNTSGTVTRTYNLAAFRADMLAFKALHAGLASDVAVTLYRTASSELTADLHNTGATLARSANDDAELGPSQGFIGRLHGVQLWETDNLPTESTGHSGLMTHTGDRASGYGVVVNQMPTIIPTRYDDAESRAGTYFVGRQHFGAGLTNPNKCLEILQK